MHDVAEVAAPASASVGSLIDELYELGLRKKEIEAQLNDLKAEIEEREKVVMGLLDQQEITLGRGRVGKVSITENVVPNVVDWEAFGQYVIENGALYLMERRPSVKAWRELHESGDTPPGTTPFTKRGLSVRKA